MIGSFWSIRQPQGACGRPKSRCGRLRSGLLHCQRAHYFGALYGEGRSIDLNHFWDTLGKDVVSAGLLAVGQLLLVVFAKLYQRVAGGDVDCHGS